MQQAFINRLTVQQTGAQIADQRYHRQWQKIRQGTTHLCYQNDSGDRCANDSGKCPCHRHNDYIIHIAGREAEHLYGDIPENCPGKAAKDKQREENTARGSGAEADKGERKFHCQQKKQCAKHHDRILTEHFDHRMSAAKHIAQTQGKPTGQQHCHHHTVMPQTAFCKQCLHLHRGFVVQYSKQAADDSQQNQHPVIAKRKGVQDFKMKCRSQTEHIAG